LILEASASEFHVCYKDYPPPSRPWPPSYLYRCHAVDGAAIAQLQTRTHQAAAAAATAAAAAAAAAGSRTSG